MPEPPKQITIYADGGAEPNPGPGGYGVILIFGTHRRELFGGFRRTTNNRMEITAVIKALQALKQPCKVNLHSDSKYVVEAMSKGWGLNWQRKGWRHTQSKPVPNADLWQTLLALCQTHDVHFEWVKGHAGHPENERCDALSMQFLQMTDLAIDEGYESPSCPSAPPLLLPISPPPSPSQPHPPSPRAKVTAAGDPCRKCQTPVIQRTPRRRAHRPGHDFYYEYFLYCPACLTFYMPEDAKRLFTLTPTSEPPARPASQIPSSSSDPTSLDSCQGT
jgi:ribonuclease HI